MMQNIQYRSELSETTTDFSLSVEPALAKTITAPINPTVVFANFEKPDEDLPAGAIPASQLLEKLEADPVRRERLFAARLRLFEKLYADKQETLTSLRFKKGWSQMRLAEEIGTSQSHIARIESGREDPRSSTVKRLAVALGISIDAAFNAIDNTINSRKTKE